MLDYLGLAVVILVVLVLWDPTGIRKRSAKSERLAPELPPNPPNKYTGHPHGCLCKECVSCADIDHEDRKIQLQKTSY
jgi:hypothetical protein